MKKLALNIPKLEKKESQKQIVINFPPESTFDYEEVLELGRTPRQDIAKELTEYITIRMEEQKRVNWYFNIKYFDEKNNTMLRLFVKQKGELAGRIVWNVVGVIKEEDFDEEMEEYGQNKFWYDTKINFTGLPYDDWVVRLRIKEEVERALMEELYGKD